MVECNSPSTIIYQEVGNDQCCEIHNSCESSRVPVLKRWRRVLKNILAYTRATHHQNDKYQPVLLGGGSCMLVRCEPEAIFREGK